MSDKNGFKKFGSKLSLGLNIKLTEEEVLKGFEKAQKKSQNTSVNENSDMGTTPSIRINTSEIHENKNIQEESNQKSITEASINPKESSQQKVNVKKEFLKVDYNVPKEVKKVLPQEDEEIVDVRSKKHQKTQEEGKKISSAKKSKKEETKKDIFGDDFADDFFNEGIKDYFGNDIKIITETSQYPRSAPQKNRINRSFGVKKKFDKIYHKNVLNEEWSVESVAEHYGENVKLLLKKLKEYDIDANESSVVDVDVMHAIIEDIGHQVTKIIRANKAIEDFEKYFESHRKNLVPAKPIVAIMGHVDHGKTTLLDKIRETRVADKEAGGITQAIGAYKVSVGGKSITFLDTPGHAAFTKIREVGAKVTNVIIIIVSAVDSVMPQTVESIEYAKKTNAIIILAINKIDANGANPNKVKQEIMSYGLVPEEYGGDVSVVEISALNGTNIDKLLDTILFRMEMAELKCHENTLFKGFVIESKLDKNIGCIANVVVAEGVINVGDKIVCGNIVGKVRAIHDSNGKSIKIAEAGDPVEIIGLSALVRAGETIYSYHNDKIANGYVDFNIELKAKNTPQKTRKSLSEEEMLLMLSDEHVEKQKLNYIIKTDNYGSLDGIMFLIQNIDNNDFEICVKNAAVGNITEQDIEMARTTNSKIIGFNVKFVNSKLKDLIDRYNLSCKFYDIIYRISDDIYEDIKSKSSKVLTETTLGVATVKKVFNFSGVGIIAGCVVSSGKIVRNATAKIMRGNEEIYRQKILSIKEQKNELKEQTTGRECGLLIKDLIDLQEGDNIVCLEIK